MPSLALRCRTAGLGLLTVALATGGCRVGGLDTGAVIAREPAGIRVWVNMPGGPYYGELLELRPEGLLLLLDRAPDPALLEQPVVLAVASGVVRAGTDEPDGGESGRDVRLDSEEHRRWLQRLGRFPYGMSPEVERRLLELHGQDSIAVLTPRRTQGRSEADLAVGTGALRRPGASDVGPPAEPAATGERQARTRAFVSRVERAIRDFRDRDAAIRHGYRRIGPDFPGMGEHWVNPGRVLAGGVDPAAPQILTYVEVRGIPYLTGAAFALPLAEDEEPPEEPVGREPWHDHGGSIDEEALILESPHTMDAGDGGPRLAMFHTWTWPPNPDGPLAQNNWALPWVRLGLTPPESPDPAVARALSLLGGGEAYYRTLLERAAGLYPTDPGLHHGAVGRPADSARPRSTGSSGAAERGSARARPSRPDVQVIHTAVERAGRRALDIVRRTSDSARTLDRRQTRELAAVWRGLWRDLREGVTPESWERLHPAFLGWGGAGGAAAR